MTADRLLIAVQGPGRAGIEERFWKYVARGEPDECWPWIGTRRQNGYGQLHVAGQPSRAHRVSYCLAYDALDTDVWVLHRCDTPPCVNPAHLFTGSQQDNVRDACIKERLAKQKLRADEVALAKRLHAAGGSFYGLGRYFNVHKSTIRRAIRGDSWRHVA